MADTKPIEGTVMCQETASGCRCREGIDHDGPHICPCGGSWHYDAGGQFQIDALPDISRGPIPGLRFDDERW